MIRSLHFGAENISTNLEPPICRFFDTIKKKVASSLDISEESFVEESTFDKECLEKANSFDKMIELLTNKLAECTTSKKKTLISWTYQIQREGKHFQI